MEQNTADNKMTEQEREYGMEKCPYEDPELVNKAIRMYGEPCCLCYDREHFGQIVCGLCGANKEFAEEAQENFLSGITRAIEEDKQKES